MTEETAEKRTVHRPHPKAVSYYPAYGGVYRLDDPAFGWGNATASGFGVSLPVLIPYTHQRPAWLGAALAKAEKITSGLSLSYAKLALEAAANAHVLVPTTYRSPEGGLVIEHRF